MTSLIPPLLPSLDDLVLCVSTVNGSGSQSANQILMRCLAASGIPVGGKNIFPSNIAGMPTWFWIRVNARGFLGKTREADVLVNLNPTTLSEDLLTLKPGGLLISNSETSPASPESQSGAPDFIRLSVPYRELSENLTDSIKTRKLLQNTIYVGLLTELWDLPESLCSQVLQSHFRGKAEAPNLQAFERGRSFAKTWKKATSSPLSSSRGSTLSTEETLLITGNSAAALGAIVGGFQFCSWYPITPSTSIVEELERLSPLLRPKIEDGTNTYAIVQAEDEIGAISMAVGAGWAGCRSMTATSGPGISLMQEMAGFSYYSNTPVVIWDVQRAGPSTGLPTRSLQGDILSCVYASHGDTLFPCLIPANPLECFEFAQEALNLAENLQQLVFVLSDLDLGMNLFCSSPLSFPTEPINRGKRWDLPMDATRASEEGLSLPYERLGDPDGDGIPHRVIPGLLGPEGNALAYQTRSSSPSTKSHYTESPQEYQWQMDRLKRKWTTAQSLVPKPLIRLHEDSNLAEVGLIAFGSSDLIMEEAQYLLVKEKGLKTDYLRLRAIPFTAEVEEFLKQHQRLYVVEQNRDGQMMKVLQTEFPLWAPKLRSIPVYHSHPITALDVFEPLTQAEALFPSPSSSPSPYRSSVK